MHVIKKTMLPRYEKPDILTSVSSHCEKPINLMLVVMFKSPSKWQWSSYCTNIKNYNELLERCIYLFASLLVIL